MKPIWHIDSRDVLNFQGQPEEYVRFLNALLEQQVREGRIPLSALRLNLTKIFAADKGVDAAVDQAVPRELDRIGLFDGCTCWQFKASATGNLSPQEKTLRNEIGKEYSRELIAQGYGYRFCIADDLPPAQIEEWERWLLDEARKINPTAPPPRVVPANMLAGWGNRFPGIILTFRPYLEPFQSLRTWGKEITSQTPHFVQVAAWQSAAQILRNHSDTTIPCIRVVQTVQGEAGVGKTRCVYETLSLIEANQALVVYTTDESKAEMVADILANDDRFTAIIVVDECSVESRVRIDRRLQPHSNRLRVIAIHNRQQDQPTGGGEIRLDQMEEREVEQILERHYPQLSRERLRAFVSWSGRFVRLALELCAQSNLVPPADHLYSLVGFFRDQYLRYRLPHEEERQTIEAIALLPRVGYKGDVRQQLEWLCQAVGLNPEKVIEAAARLKQAPGFIALGERYLYVTPRLIAQAAFQSAWARWIQYDPDRFFIERLHNELIDGFADQIRICGSPEMKQVFSRFFQNWTSRLTARDLANEATVSRLVRLVEIEPQTLLPQLRRLIESIGVEELRQLHSSPFQSAARRELVWLADKLLRLPDHFGDAERILLRLALAETEAYVNNASGVWRDLFRPLLSGTAITFAERIRLLEERFQTTNSSQITLCLGALDGPLTMDGPIVGRALGPPVIAGRIPPPDWYPRNNKESHECASLTFELLKRLTRSDNAAVRNGVVTAMLNHLGHLLRCGFLTEVKEFLNAEPLSDLRLAELLHALDWFLEVFCNPNARRTSADLEKAVRDWRRSLVPKSLHGQLISLIGQEPWYLWNQGDDHAESAIKSLAQELLNDPLAFEQELPWLCSREARSAPRLGVVLGRLDAEGTHLERIVKVAAASQYLGVARGYIQGLVQNHPGQADRVNELLDRLQATNPDVVFDLISDGVESLHPLKRLLAMIDAGQLPVEALQGVGYTLGNRSLNPAELRQVLERLIAGTSQGNEAAARAALAVLYGTLRVRAHFLHPDIPSDPWLRTNFGSILNMTLPFAGSESHAWNDLLKYFGKIDLTGSIRLAVLALIHDNPSLHIHAESYLVAAAAQEPNVIMERLGEALLDAATRWRLMVLPSRTLIDALPVKVVKQWLDAHSLPAAIALARHLPAPYIDNANNPIVPELTGYVLEKFSEDDTVFQEFCLGVHSGKAYWGDMAAHNQREGEVARRFLDHPQQRIREWAQYEIDRATHDATWWRVRDEEMAVPS